MDMRRLDARNYAVYLQRRVEDYVDPERPMPKWTELDRAAVRELVREFRRLDRAIETMEAHLQESGLSIPPLLEEEDDEEALSAWMIAPQPHVPVDAPARRFRLPWRRQARNG